MKSIFKIFTLAFVLLSATTFAKTAEVSDITTVSTSVVKYSENVVQNSQLQNLNVSAEQLVIADKESNLMLADYNCATAYGDSWTVTVCSNASPEDNASLACGLADYLDANYP